MWASGFCRRKYDRVTCYQLESNCFKRQISPAEKVWGQHFWGCNQSRISSTKADRPQAVQQRQSNFSKVSDWGKLTFWYWCASFCFCLLFPTFVLVSVLLLSFLISSLTKRQTFQHSIQSSSLSLAFLVDIFILSIEVSISCLRVFALFVIAYCTRVVVRQARFTQSHSGQINFPTICAIFLLLPIVRN